MRRIGAVLLFIATLVGVPGSTSAGPYSDDLAKCLVGATSPEDKSTLVKWVFSIASLHPALGSVSAVTGAQRAQTDREVAALFEALLTDRCRKQTQSAVRYEGEKTIGTAFEVLGQAAMMELFSDPSVAKGLGAFTEHLDQKKLDALLGKTAQEP
jgi:hypothetical protein